jgi:hypothetical protein
MEMVHLPKITLAVEFSARTVAMPGVKPPKSSESFVRLNSYEPFILL